MTALLGFLLLFAASPGQPAYERANALFVQQRFADSRAAIDEALQLDPDLIPALTLKAKLAMAINRFDVARESLQHALAVDPKAQYAQFLYGMEAYLTNDMQSALGRFRKAYDLNPKDPRAVLYLGLSTEAMGNPAEALRLYEDVWKLDPRAETLLPRIRLLLLLGRAEEAERWAHQAVKLAPKLRDTHFELARVLLKQGTAELAAVEGEEALRLSGGVTNDAQIHYLLIRAWRQSGAPEKSDRHAAALRALETPARPPPEVSK